MSKFILHGPSVFTNIDNADLCHDAVLIVDEKIAAVGPPAELQTLHPDATVEKLPEGLLLPGLVNLHHHLYSSLARGLIRKNIAPHDFSEVLKQIWWRLDEKLSLDEIYHSAMVGLIDSVLAGVTTIVDHHSSQTTITGSLERIAAAFQQVGVRGSICFELSDRGGTEAFRAGLAESMAALERWPAGSGQPQIVAMLGMHASFTLTDESLAAIADAVQGKECGFHFHLAEDEIDQNISLENYGQRATHRLAAFGLINERSLAVHGVHLDPTEIKRLAEMRPTLVLCPRSNQNNGVGFARWWDYDGMILGLGTDGLGSDMIGEAKAGIYLTSFMRRLPSCAFADFQRILLENNPRAYQSISGVAVGRIAPGYAADLVYWPYQSPTPIDSQNIWAHILYGLVGMQPHSVWVAGRRIVKEGNFVNFDLKQFVAETRKVAGNLWRRI